MASRWLKSQAQGLTLTLPPGEPLVGSDELLWDNGHLPASSEGKEIVGLDNRLTAIGKQRCLDYDFINEGVKHMKYGMRKPSLKEIAQCQNEGQSNSCCEKGIDSGLW